MSIAKELMSLRLCKRQSLSKRHGADFKFSSLFGSARPSDSAAEQPDVLMVSAR
jgi:hypothetical protein